MPKYSEAEMEAIRRSEAVAEAVRLDDDEEAALGTATVDDLVNIEQRCHIRFLIFFCIMLDFEAYSEINSGKT